MQRKNFGSKPLVNLYQNFMHWTSNISLTLSNFSSLNKGSVCPLYLLRVIIRMARFCNLIILLVSKPQQVIPNCDHNHVISGYTTVSFHPYWKQVKLVIASPHKCKFLEHLVPSLAQPSSHLANSHWPSASVDPSHTCKKKYFTLHFSMPTHSKIFQLAP